MPQTFPYPASATASEVDVAPPNVAIDDRVLHDMQKLAGESAERSAFHQAELDRWSRAHQAAIAAIKVLEGPMAQSEQGVSY